MTKREPIDYLFLFLLLLASFCARLYYLNASNFVIDADEAIVGLMGKHFLEGAPVTTFYYGQNYMGSFEGILSGLIFSWIGVSSFALKLVPFIFSLLFILCVFEITRLLTNRHAAWIAAFLAAFPGQVFLDWGTKARGGFIEVIVLGACAVALILPWFRDQSRIRLIAVSVVLGLGWWVNNQIIFFMVTIGLYVFGSLLHSNRPLRERGADILIGILSFLIGGAPFWIYNIRNNFVSFDMFTAAHEGHALSYLWGMISISLPMLGGAKRFWGSEDIWTGASALFALLYISILLRVLWVYRKEMKNFLFRLHPSTKPTSILILFLVVTATIFSMSSFGHLYQAPRYLLPLYVAWFPLIGIGINSWWHRSKIFSVIILLGVLVLQWGSDLSPSFGLAIPGQPHVVGTERVAKDHNHVITELLRRKIDFVRTDYWIGNRLAFEANEKIRFLAFDDPYTNRVPGYVEEAIARGRSLLPLLLVNGQLSAAEAALTVQGIGYDKDLIEPYWLLSNLHMTARFENEIAISAVKASAAPEVAFMAIDGDIKTRWGSNARQSSQMSFEIQLSKKSLLCGMTYAPGSFTSDIPERLRIVGIDSEGGEHELLSPVRYRQLKPLIQDQPTFSVLFNPPEMVQTVRLEQRGENPLVDWSISEIEFFEGCK